jgi:hypothetical protein
MMIFRDQKCSPHGTKFKRWILASNLKKRELKLKPDVAKTAHLAPLCV